MLYSEIIAVCSQIHTKHISIYLLNVKLVVRDKWVPVTRAWGVPQVADGGTASNMEGSCEYIE